MAGMVPRLARTEKSLVVFFQVALSFSFFFAWRQATVDTLMGSLRLAVLAIVFITAHIAYAQPKASGYDSYSKFAALYLVDKFLNFSTAASLCLPS
jgi:hypothetical protein